MSIYNDFDACSELILHNIIVHITICTHRLFDKFIVFFHNSLFFLEKYVFDIEQTLVTLVQFPATNSACSGKCSASFHAVHGCFSQKNMSRLNMHFFKRWFNYD